MTYKRGIFLTYFFELCAETMKNGSFEKSHAEEVERYGIEYPFWKTGIKNAAINLRLIKNNDKDDDGA